MDFFKEEQKKTAIMILEYQRGYSDYEEFKDYINLVLKEFKSFDEIVFFYKSFDDRTLIETYLREEKYNATIYLCSSTKEKKSINRTMIKEALEFGDEAALILFTTGVSQDMKFMRDYCLNNGLNKIYFKFIKK